MNRNKAKGTTYESAIVAYLRESGYPYADRRVLSGRDDQGDIRLGDGVSVTLEAKNQASIALSQFVDEAMAERKNAKVDFAAAVIKRRGKGVAESYAVMPLWLLVDLFHRAGL